MQDEERGKSEILYHRKFGDFSSLDSVIGMEYSSDLMVRRQLVAISSMMMDYCDNLGELLHLTGICFYFTEDITKKMEKMLQTLKNYRGKISAEKDENLIFVMENEIENIENVCKIASEINSRVGIRRKISGNDKMLKKNLLNSYVAFDSFVGNDEKNWLELESIVSKIDESNFKNLKFSYSALRNEKVFATKSIAKLYSKLTEFLKDNASPNSRIVFSAGRKDEVAGISDGLTECEIWCSSHQLTENKAVKPYFVQQIPDESGLMKDNIQKDNIRNDNTRSDAAESKAYSGSGVGGDALIELIKSDWRLLIAEYVLEKNDSTLEMSPLNREYLDIKFSLKSHNTSDV